jgi:hypothetical protein
MNFEVIDEDDIDPRFYIMCPLCDDQLSGREAEVKPDINTDLTVEYGCVNCYVDITCKFPSAYYADKVEKQIMDEIKNGSN